MKMSEICDRMVMFSVASNFSFADPALMAFRRGCADLQALLEEGDVEDARDAISALSYIAHVVAETARHGQLSQRDLEVLQLLNKVMKYLLADGLGEKLLAEHTASLATPHSHPVFRAAAE